MKCTNCLYDGSCTLQTLAEDIIGCDGHSKERPPKEGEVKCRCCGEWVNEKEAFKHKDKDYYICFKCY